MKTDGAWIGQAVPRKEDARLLSGQGRFMADLSPVPGIRHAAIVRSPHAHAKVLKVDASQAEAMPGVFGVVSAHDLLDRARPMPVAAAVPSDYYPLAVDRVRFVGEPVAVVVAASRALAEDAAARVRVEYEALPAVVDIEVALASDAPVLHDGMTANLAVDRHLEYGDAAAAFAAAHRVVRGRYYFPKVNSSPIETYGVVAEWGPGDQVTVWANFQGPFSMHPVMARALGVSENQLRVIVPGDIGGGFGIKISIYPYMVLMSLVSWKLGCPVKWIEDRLEALAASSSGTDRLTEIEAAVDANGEVLAWNMRLVDNVGAYIRAPEPGSLFRATGNFVNAYKTRNLSVWAQAVMTNKCPTGPNRGYGVAPLYFAMERMMDKIAAEMNLDPAEVRRRNLIPGEQMPYRTPTGGFYDSGDYPDTFEKALSLADYPGLLEERETARQAGRWFGVGIAVGVDPAVSNMGYIDIVTPPEERKPGRNKSGAGQGAQISIDASGGVNVTLSTCAQGQGHETVAAQVAGEILGVNPANVRVVAGMDTATRNWTIATGAYASRFSATGGPAVAKAAEMVREKLCRIAAHLLEADVADVEYADGAAFVRGVPGRSIPLRRLAGVAHWDLEALPPGMEPGLAAESYVTLDQLKAIDGEDQVNSSGTYGFMADVVAVEVNPETFEVEIRKYVTVHDIGRVLNPRIVEGQIYGAALHGLGAALLEEVTYDEDGQLLTGTFMDYLLPSAPEAPVLTIGHTGEPTPFTPLGAKGVGESTTETVPAALANAISDAVGVPVDRLPVTPARLFAWTQSAESGMPVD